MRECRSCGVRSIFLITDPRGTCLGCAAIEDVGDPREVECDVRSARLRRGGWSLGERYVFRRSRLAFLAARPITVFRWEEALWLYPRVLETRINWIPVGRSWCALLHFPNFVIKIPARGEHDAQSIITFASQRAPWAITGYSELREAQWLSRQHEIWNEVDARKRVMPRPS